MNYVIQNFYKISLEPIIIPRTYSLIISNNIIKIFFFYKYNLNTFFLHQNNHLFFTYRFEFLKYFFQHQLFKIKKKIKLKVIGFYNNKLKQSLIYNIFKTLIQSFKILNVINTQSEKYLTVPLENTLSHNIYFLPLKVLKEKVNNDFSRNIFFFLMVLSSSP